VTGSKIVLRLS